MLLLISLLLLQNGRQCFFRITSCGAKRRTGERKVATDARRNARVEFLSFMSCFEFAIV